MIFRNRFKPASARRVTGEHQALSMHEIQQNGKRKLSSATARKVWSEQLFDAGGAPFGMTLLRPRAHALSRTTGAKLLENHHLINRPAGAVDGASLNRIGRRASISRIMILLRIRLTTQFESHTPGSEGSLIRVQVFQPYAALRISLPPAGF